MTSTETRASWSDRLSPRNWSLAWKLVAVGLVPALLAIVLGVLRVADQAQTASELGTANRQLQVRTQVLNDDLRTTFDRWYPGLKVAPALVARQACDGRALDIGNGADAQDGVTAVVLHRR